MERGCTAKKTRKTDVTNLNASQVGKTMGQRTGSPHKGATGKQGDRKKQGKLSGAKGVRERGTAKSSLKPHQKKGPPGRFFYSTSRGTQEEKLNSTADTQDIQTGDRSSSPSVNADQENYTMK